MKIYLNCFVCGLNVECEDNPENSAEMASLVEKHYKETKHTPIRLASVKRKENEK